MNEYKYAYIIMNNKSGEYIGYSTNKDLAIQFTIERKNTFYKKVKYSKIKSFLDTHDDELTFALYSDVLMTLTEEEFFLESIYQYMVDIIHDFDKLKSILNIIKIKDDEVKYINKLCDIIRNYKLVYEKHCEECIPDINEIFDMNECAKWFVNNVLEGAIQ